MTAMPPERIADTAARILELLALVAPLTENAIAVSLGETSPVATRRALSRLLDERKITARIERFKCEARGPRGMFDRRYEALGYRLAAAPLAVPKRKEVKRR